MTQYFLQIPSIFGLAGAFALILSLCACATSIGAPPGAVDVRQGVIEEIKATQLQNCIQAQHTDVDQALPGQQVVVRTDSGVIEAVTQPVNAALYPGMLVCLEGSGVAARVVPRR